MSPEATAGRPILRRLYDSLEGPLGHRLEQLVESERFGVLAAAGRRAELELRDRRLGALSSVLHACDLPAHSDLQRLVRHIARLEARLRELEHQLEMREGDERAHKPTKDKVGTRT